MPRIKNISPAMVIACLALIVALSGTSYAALALPTGSVGSKQLKNRSIRKVDIGKRTLASLAGTPGPQGPAGPRGPAGPAGVAGPAGGDLTGTYPKPSIREGAVAGPEVADDSLTGADVDEKTLAKVPNADTLDGRDSFEFQRYARTNVTLDLPAIAAHACINKLIFIPQLIQNDAVVVNPPGNFPIGLVLTATADINKDTLQELRVCNTTNGSLDAPNGGFTFTLLRP